MNFPAEHIERIRELGYTEPEARFLYIVAVHSGYFTLGQFRSFTKTSYGKRPTSFAQKLLKQGHATVRDYMRRGSIFHLFSRIVYGQIEKDNLRNRKKHSFDFMRARLVLLDFILANPEWTYFETEQDKVQFFCEELGIPKESLPAKVYEGGPHSKPTLRYFIDRFPLFLAPPFPGAHPVVTLSYVDSGFETPSHFAAHLGAYQRLFRELRSFRFLYIAAKDAYFRKARERFRTAVETPLESDVASEVLRYFEIRRKWERHEYVVPVTQDLEFLNEARRRFSGDRFQALYQSWALGTTTEPQLLAELSPLRPERQVWFGTFLVREHRSPVSEVFRRGDGCVKDTRNPSCYRSRHREVFGSLEDAHWRDIFLDAGKTHGRSLQPSEQGNALFTKCLPPSIQANQKGEIMSIINKPPEMVKREYELQEPIALAVEKYATFIQSTPDHVVNSALKMVIWRDVEFRRWRKQQQTQSDRKDGQGAGKAARA
jgi:hypothetical protein